MNLHRSFEELIAKYRGLFTHGYFSCGYLEDKAPFFCHQVLPSNEDIFDLSSLTKPLVTANLVKSHLLDAGVEQVGDLARGRMFSASVQRLSLSSLINHKSGLPFWSNFWINRLHGQSEAHLKTNAAQHILQVFGRLESRIKPPGEDCYSDVGYILLGDLLEHESGVSLAQLFANQAEQMQDGGFLIDEKRAIATGYCKIRETELKGQVHDENAAALGGFAGHAGLFGSGQCVERLVRAVWLDGLRPGDDEASSQFFSGHSRGHWGFTGTGFWIGEHQDRRPYAILLTNRVISGRRSNSIKQLRAQILNYMNSLYDT